MDARTHGVLVNAAGFLYASLGFSLSVLAALLGLFHRSDIKPKPPSPRKLAKPHLHPTLSRSQPSSRPQRMPLRRSFSEQSPKSPVPISFSTPKLIESSQEGTMRRKMLASHRRSRSIPIITIDFYDSIDNLRQVPVENANSSLIDAPLPPLPKPKRLTFVVTAPERDVRPAPAVESTERPVFRLANLWIKDKEKDRPRVSRRGSAPQLRTGRLPKSPAPTFVRPKTTHKASSSDETLSDSQKCSSKLKRRKPIRKVPSVPGSVEEKLATKFDSFTRTIEKKKSLPLRTQPYEAPFFCPPPLPISSSSKPSSSSESKSIRKRPSKSRTLKT